jgi:hypothetical protein
MGKHRKPSKPTAKEIGYCRAPASSRWGPGQSGNPSGKRKGAKSWSDIVIEFMDAKAATVVENGKRRRVSRHEALLHSDFKLAMNGNLKASSELREKLAAARAAEATRQRHEIRQITGQMTLQEASDMYAQTVRRRLPDTV